MTDPVRLTDNAEVLLRQVHPTHLKTDGTISTGAFTPTARDAGMLSTTRGAVGASEAHRRWVGDGHESLGTYGISVGEIDEVEVDLGDEETCGLRALDDAAHVKVEDHASIDFTDVPTKGKVRQAGRKIRDVALKRGMLHPPN